MACQLSLCGAERKGGTLKTLVNYENITRINCIIYYNLLISYYLVVLCFDGCI